MSFIVSNSRIMLSLLNRIRKDAERMAREGQL